MCLTSSQLRQNTAFARNLTGGQGAFTLEYLTTLPGVPRRHHTRNKSQANQIYYQLIHAPGGTHAHTLRHTGAAADAGRAQLAQQPHAWPDSLRSMLSQRRQRKAAAL